MGNQSSKSSLKAQNRSKQVNFLDNGQQSKCSGIKSPNRKNDALTKFVWNYGGNTVYLTGSFNNWKKDIMMQKQGDQFSITLLLPRQIHQYKFIVDGDWRFSPDDATMSDDNGYINNYIDTTNFSKIQGSSNKDDIDDLSGPLFKKTEKQLSKNKEKKEQYAKYAPKISPHYEHCLYLGENKKKIANLENGLLGNHRPNNIGNFQAVHHNKYNHYLPHSYNRSYELDRNSLPTQQNTQNNNNINANANKLYRIQEEGDENYQALLTKQQIEYLFNTPHSLPMPSHIVLDHAMMQKGEWYSAMAITQRFKDKYTTFIHYTMSDDQSVQKDQNNIGMMNDNVAIVDKNMNISILNLKNNKLLANNVNRSNQSQMNQQQIHEYYQHVYHQNQQNKGYINQNNNSNH